jgi:hypothetical protein
MVLTAPGLGARAPVGQQLPGLLLEGHGDVQAAPAVGDEGAHVAGEALQAAEQSAIGHALAGLPREGRVDLRRLAVRDGVTDDGVVIHGWANGKANYWEQLYRAASRCGGTKLSQTKSCSAWRPSVSGSRDSDPIPIPISTPTTRTPWCISKFGAVALVIQPLAACLA